MLRLSSRTVALSAVGAAAVAGCSTTVELLDEGPVEQSLSRQVAQTTGERPRSVTCPEDVTQAKGEEFDCEVNLADGSERKAAVTLTDDEGRFRFELKR